MGKLVRRGPAHRGKRPRRKSATAFFGEGLAKRDPRNSAQDRRGKARQGRDRRGEARRGQERQGKASKAAVKCCQQRGLGAQPFQLTRCPLAESQCMAPKTHLRPPCWRAPPQKNLTSGGAGAPPPRNGGELLHSRSHPWRDSSPQAELEHSYFLCNSKRDMFLFCVTPNVIRS